MSRLRVAQIRAGYEHETQALKDGKRSGGWVRWAFQQLLAELESRDLDIKNLNQLVDELEASQF